MSLKSSKIESIFCGTSKPISCCVKLVIQSASSFKVFETLKRLSEAWVPVKITALEFEGRNTKAFFVAVNEDRLWTGEFIRGI